VGDEVQLPLDNVPVLAFLTGQESPSKWQSLLLQARQMACPVCISIHFEKVSALAVKRLGESLRNLLIEQLSSMPPLSPLILVVSQNIGHALGSYITEWNRLPLPVIVLDEVPIKEARFVRIGAPLQQVIPVTFYGFGQI
jgi:ethanolamine utilization protein EutA